MTEKPILFSGDMVRAILDGRKTQTRRVIKPQPSESWHPEVGIYAPTRVDRQGEEYPGKDVFGASDECEGRICHYGQPGDRMWVRETFSPCACGGCKEAWPRRWESSSKIGQHDVTYREGYGGPSGIIFSPSIFMPRWASRLTLEITKIRIERVQEISFDDCISEGIIHTDFWDKCKAETVPDDLGTPDGDFDMDRGWEAYAKEAFRDLWNSINGKRGFGWDANPWVWVIEFELLRGEKAQPQS